jgi:hypothetical protein
MERFNLPLLFLGPAGAGKTQEARRLIEQAHNAKLTLPLEVRNFTIGDGYEARVYTSPYHFEIDIPNLSMQDKQIIGDLLTQFFSSCDVLSSLKTSSRKLVILRRAHALSLHAAVRVRAIIQQFVLPSDAAGMLWITAREITGPLSLLEDAFVRYRMPRISLPDWIHQTTPLGTMYASEEGWERCEGRLERAQELAKYYKERQPVWVRRISDFYDEMMISIINTARSGIQPNLNVVLWIRSLVYQMLSFCGNGPEIIDQCSRAIESQHKLLEAKVFWIVMKSLTKAETHTSYRTPLSLEAALLDVYETIRINSSVIPLEEKPVIMLDDRRSTENIIINSEPTAASPVAKGTKKPVKPRVRKNTTTGGLG